MSLIEQLEQAYDILNKGLIGSEDISEARKLIKEVIIVLEYEENSETDVEA